MPKSICLSRAVSAMISMAWILSPKMSIVSASRARPPGATKIPGTPFRSMGLATRARREGQGPFSQPLRSHVPLSVCGQELLTQQHGGQYSGRGVPRSGPCSRHEPLLGWRSNSPAETSEPARREKTAVEELVCPHRGRQMLRELATALLLANLGRDVFGPRPPRGYFF